MIFLLGSLFICCSTFHSLFYLLLKPLFLPLSYDIFYKVLHGNPSFFIFLLSFYLYKVHHPQSFYPYDDRFTLRVSCDQKHCYDHTTYNVDFASTFTFLDHFSSVFQVEWMIHCTNNYAARNCSFTDG